MPAAPLRVPHRRCQPRRRLTPRPSLLLLAATLLLPACHTGTPSEGDEVWAKVNGRPIYREQVEVYYERQVAALPEPLTAEEEQARKLTILDDMIQTEILWQRAVRAGLTATDAEVEARVESLRASSSEEDFERQMGEQGLTLDELKAELRRDIAIDKLLDQALGAGVTVSDQEVADYYNQFKSRFRLIEAQYHVAHILVTPRREPEVRNLRNEDAVNEDQARRKIQFLLERLRAGDDFAELARNYSEDANSALSGGDLGFFPESALGQTHAALRSVLQHLDVGAVGGPVRTEDGYELVELLERNPPGQRDLNDPKVQQTIRERLRQQKRHLLEAAYVAQARNRADVVNYLARQILESHRIAP